MTFFWTLVLAPLLLMLLLFFYAWELPFRLKWVLWPSFSKFRLRALYSSRRVQAYLKQLELNAKTVFSPAFRWKGGISADDLILVDALIQAAHTYRDREVYTKAELLAGQAVQIQLAVFGPNSSSVTSSLELLSSFTGHRGWESPGSHPEYFLLEWALLTVSSKNTYDTSDAARLLEKLAAIHREMDEMERSGRWAVISKLALRMLREHLGRHDPAIAQALVNTANKMSDTAAVGEVEPPCLPLHREALAIREMAFGKNHPAVAESLEYIAAVQYINENQQEADGFLDRALAIRAGMTEPGTLQTAAALEQRAALYKRMGRHIEEGQALRRSLHIREELQGPAHPGLIDLLQRLGDSIQRGRGDVSTAERLHLKALELAEKLWDPKGEKVSSVHMDISDFYFRIGDDAQGSFHAGKEFEFEGEWATGPTGREDASDEEIAKRLLNLGNSFRNVGRHKDAEVFINHGRRIMELSQ